MPIHQEIRRSGNRELFPVKIGKFFLFLELVPGCLKNGESRVKIKAFNQFFLKLNETYGKPFIIAIG
jgi:hypothetical protein